MTRVLTIGAELGDAFPFLAGTAVADAAHTGSYGYRFSSSTAYGITSYSSYYIRAWVKLVYSNNGQTFFAFRNTSSYWQGHILLNSSTGALDYYTANTYRSSGTVGLVSLDTWFLLEAYILTADSSGRFVVKIDGVTDCDYTGDTNSSGNVVTQFLFNKPHSTDASSYIYVDDLALNNIIGTSDNSWIGDGRVVMLYPAGNGYINGWNGSDGNSTDNYLLVDEKPHDTDTTYVSASITTITDAYTLSSLGLSDVNILCVKEEGRIRTVSGIYGSGTAALLKRIGSTNYVGSTSTITTTSYDYIEGNQHTTNPATSSAWTLNDLSSLQAGITKPTTSDTIRLTTLGVMVEYLPITGRILGPAVQIMG